MMQFFTKKQKGNGEKDDRKPTKRKASKGAERVTTKRRPTKRKATKHVPEETGEQSNDTSIKPELMAKKVKTLSEILGSDDGPKDEPRLAKTLRDELCKPVAEFEITLHPAPSFTEPAPVFKYADALWKRDDLLRKKESKRQAQIDRLAELSQDADTFLAKERKKKEETTDGMPDVFMSSTFNISDDVAGYCDGLLKPLWLYPEETGPFKRKNPRKYPIYDTRSLNKTKKKYLRLPRAYGVSCFPDVHTDWHEKLMSFVKKAPNIKQFRGSLLPHQKKAVAHVIAMLKELQTHSGLLEAACGSGKTVMALYICSMLGIPAAFVVHTGPLMTQWVKRAEQFLPDAKIGVCQGATRPAADADVCICMLQTVMKLQDTSFLDRYGIVVFDETHHIAAESFSKAGRAFTAPYVLGLSATLSRGDGLHYSIDWLIGPKLVKIERVSTAVEVLPVCYKNPGFEHASYEWDASRMDWQSTISLIVSDAWRTRRLAEIIYELATREKRCIIVICKRVQLAKDLHALLPGSGLFAGSSKKKSEIAKRQAAKMKRVIIASQALAAEGLDVGFLDTVVLATYVKVKPDDDKDISQLIGRVQRGYSRKRPLVIDFYDNYQMFAGMYRARRKYYSEKQYFFRKTRRVDLPQVMKPTVLQTMLGPQITHDPSPGPCPGPGPSSSSESRKERHERLWASVKYDPLKTAPNQVESQTHLKKLGADVLYTPFPPIPELTEKELAPLTQGHGRNPKEPEAEGGPDADLLRLEAEIKDELIAETQSYRTENHEEQTSSELFSFLGMKPAKKTTKK